jgi:bacillithiol biosynthesis deacetylase BshB1
MPVEVLLFGAHPDDVEWGVGGITVLLQQTGVSFAIIDLTRGEMGSRGTPAERAHEAERAAHFLGDVPRENLDLPDCGLQDTPERRTLIASVIRRYRPTLVLAPFWKDRHPDHAAAGRIVRNSRLYCTLKKSASPDPPHKPKLFLYFPLHHPHARPSFVVNVSAVYERKLQLLRLHESQFAKTAEQFGVMSHGLGDYLFALESRDRYFGSLIGARHGEALVADGPLALSQLTDILKLDSFRPAP